MFKLRTDGPVEFNDKVRLTPEGGVAICLLNKTGGPSVKGSLVELCEEVTDPDDAVQLTEANSTDPIGVMYEAGVADGDPCWVVVSGRAQVLLQDRVDGQRGYWLGTGGAPGRANCVETPGLLLQHMQEIGHCSQSIAGGTNVLVYGILHFN